jgi:mannose-6-phosphate isomerase
MTAIHPLRLEPIYKQYLWGGRRFETELGRELDPNGIYAESWEVCDLGPQDISMVQVGPLAGTTLHELVANRGEQLLGVHYPQDRFPLLLKYLDANQPLSVQVHPDDELSRRMALADPGKTEAWYVIQSEPGSVIWAGFSQPVNRKQLEQSISEGTLENLLHRFEPTAGQCVYLPAGTVHALGKGILVAEIQQTSNNTFRLYDWNRVGVDGKPRPLHIAEGLQATDFSQGPVEPVNPSATEHGHVERLVGCPKFVLDRWRLDGPQTVGGDHRCHILTVLEGSIRLAGDPAQCPLNKGQTILLPAALGAAKLTPARDQGALLLDAYLP